MSNQLCYGNIAGKTLKNPNIDKAKVKGLHLSATFYLPQNIRLGGAYTFTDTNPRRLLGTVPEKVIVKGRLLSQMPLF
jgi:outer membrane receptor for ferrienterochelin and colicin